MPIAFELQQGLLWVFTKLPNLLFNLHIQSKLAIRNFLVALKVFLMPKVPYPYEIGHRKWFLNTNLLLTKMFLNAKFDCTICYFDVVTLIITLFLNTACLYIACRQEGVPRTFKEIVAVSTVSKKEIGRCFKVKILTFF